MFQTVWVLLAYSYNVILVLFIATHLFVGAIISFLVGLYIGVYLSQNYEIPKINEPRTLWEKFLDFLERNRRDPQKISMANILQPSTIKELVLQEQTVSAKSGEEIALCPTTNYQESQRNVKEEEVEECSGGGGCSGAAVGNESLLEDQDGDQETNMPPDDEMVEPDMMEILKTAEFIASPQREEEEQEQIPDNTTLIFTDNEMADMPLTDRFREISSFQALDSR